MKRKLKYVKILFGGGGGGRLISQSLLFDHGPSDSTW